METGLEPEMVDQAAEQQVDRPEPDVESQIATSSMHMTLRQWSRQGCPVVF